MSDDFSSVRVLTPRLAYTRQSNELVITIPIAYSESLLDARGNTVYRDARPQDNEVQRFNAVVRNPLTINGRTYAEWSSARIETIPGRGVWWFTDNMEGFTDAAKRKLIAHILANVTIPPLGDLYAEWVEDRRRIAEGQKASIDYEADREITTVGNLLQPLLPEERQ